MAAAAMIGIDTNVLLRMMLADDAAQVEAVSRLLASRSDEAPVFISLLVVAEASWVLKSAYRIDNTNIAAAFLQLLASSELVFEDEDFLIALFRDFPAGRSDLSDHIVAHLARRAGCLTTYTFDKAAARGVEGMELLS